MAVHQLTLGSHRSGPLVLPREQHDGTYLPPRVHIHLYQDAQPHAQVLD